jgi:hypothetical protein
MTVLNEGTYARVLDSYSYATKAPPAKPAPAKGCNLPAADQDCCDVPGAGVPVIGFLAQHICSGGKSVSKGVNAIGASISSAGESASKGGQALGNLGAGLGGASQSLSKLGIPGGLTTIVIIAAVGIGAFFLLKKL